METTTLKPQLLISIAKLADTFNILCRFTKRTQTRNKTKSGLLFTITPALM